MKFAISVATLSLVASARSAPQIRDDSVDLTFHAAADSFTVTVTTDGSKVDVDNDESVNLIDIPAGLNIKEQCTFETPKDAAFAVVYDEDGKAQLAVGPPQPITSVTCEGSCLTEYDDCFDPIKGISLGTCCSGICAANKCREMPTRKL